MDKILLILTGGTICSFENDDSLSYNQGLFAAALIAAEKLGIETGFDTEEAIRHYNEMYLEDRGYIPISIKKPQMMCLDPTIGDLLSYVLFIFKSSYTYAKSLTILPNEQQISLSICFFYSLLPSN